MAHSQPIDLIIDMRQGRIPSVQLYAIPPGTFLSHTVVLEGVDKVVVDSPSAVLSISFISENDRSITELQVYRNAKFILSSSLKKGEGENYALRIEELPRTG